MRISRLQVANDNLQNRVVLRFATQTNERFRIYFTRRLRRKSWPHLTAMLAEHLGARAAEPTVGMDRTA